MGTVHITLDDDETRQLLEAAERRDIGMDDLVTRWVRERLVHERERAMGEGKPMSPRARREAGDRSRQPDA